MSEMSGTSFKEVGDETHFSCGCKTKVIGENFIIKPCSLDCEVYRYVLDESKKLGHEISLQVVDDPK